MTAIDIRDLKNHIMHFGAYAVCRKSKPGTWWVQWRGYGSPSPFKTRKAAAEWASNWANVARPA